MRAFVSLRRRGEIARVRSRGRRRYAAHLALYVLKRAQQPSRVGISIRKTVGGAVGRNRLRRRLHALLHERLARRAPCEVFIVGRVGAAGLPFAELGRELDAALPDDA